MKRTWFASISSRESPQKHMDGFVDGDFCDSLW